jgi:hypothetical protein
MKLILAAVAFAASVMVAVAAEDPMAGRYGNTVVTTTADGKEAGRTYYNADGTFSRKTPAGEVKGTWKLDGDKLCLTQTEPAPPAGAAATCIPAHGGKKVGDSWDVTLPDGTKLKATLQKGRP